MIRRLLIANRGEIAVRIAHAAREMGIVPLGVYSDADTDAYHLSFMADAARIGPPPAPESYLDADAIVAAAKTLRADAVHPGYGFLSERPLFAKAVRDAGLIFVGPTPEAMAAMGSKIEAKRRVRAAQVPTVPGYDGDDQSGERLRDEAQRIGMPLLVKASAGGGGRGMRVVDRIEEFDEALAAAKREALAAFGDDAVLLERYLRRPRHIEIQVLADHHGNVVHLGERECSIQRRHQKVVEEAPSPAVDDALRAEMGAAAVRAAAAVGYTNAGTCEFMLDETGAYYFLEMNTRLQVEHPVTELVYGLDLVQWQLRIAAGERLTLAQAEIRPRGWAIEMRVNAEDPRNHLLPSTGTIARWSPPDGPGIRVDAGVTTGSEIGVYYDSMLAKLIVFGSDRAAAVRRMASALDDFTIDGLRTNLPLLRWIARDEAFIAGALHTGFLAERLDESIFAPAKASREALARACARALAGGAAPWRIAGVGMPIALECNGERYALEATRIADGVYHLRGALTGDLRVRHNADRLVASLDGIELGNVFDDGFRQAAPPSADARTQAAGGPADGRVIAPMPGKIAKIAVAQGDAVEERSLLIVLEAMKMEHRIESPSAGTVKAVLVREGDVVAAAQALVEIE